MNNLTEKLEKGELETNREYWVQLTDEWKNSIEQVYFNGENFECFDIDDVEEVLAPVPSYGDCLINEAMIKDLSKKVNKLIKENDKLKELLKECVEVLNNAQRNYGYDDSILDICSPIITKISEVLGEK